MRPPRIVSTPSLAALLCLACGAGLACGSGDGAAGDAPSISALSYGISANPTVGQAVVVSGQLSFEDPNRDVQRGAVEIRPPGGAAALKPTFNVPGAAGQLRGATQFAFGFVPPASGRHTFEIWLVDAQGNASNHLSGTVDVP